jgi:hypothetical protein
MKRQAWATMALGGLLMGAGARAATYYVAQEDDRAADTNPGTADQPWKTIGRCLRELQPGDTLYVRKGTYRESVVLRASPRDGFAAFPSGAGYGRMITFATWPGDEVVIKGSDVLTGWKLHRDKIWVHDQAPVPPLYALVFCDGRRLQLIGDGGGKLVESIKGWGGTPEVWKGRKGEKLEDLEAGSYWASRASTTPSGGASSTATATRASAAPGRATDSSSAKPPPTTSCGSAPAGTPAGSR